MTVINVQEAKVHLSQLLEQVTEGEVFLLGKHGKPMAMLTAFDSTKAVRPLGGLEGKIRIGSNFDDEDARIIGLFAGAHA